MKAMLWSALIGAMMLSACASHEEAAPAPVATAAPIAPAPASAVACGETHLNVYFDMFDTTLSPEARETIDAYGHTLHGCRVDHVRVVGLAGALGGTPDENMELSQRRADAVADYLATSTGWPRTQFEIVARGDQNATNEEGEARPMRRRARIIVTASPPSAP